MAHIRLGERAEGRNPLIKDFVPLASLDDLVFGGWDPISPNALEAARTVRRARRARPRPDLGELEGVVAMDAVFDQDWVSRLDGIRVKTRRQQDGAGRGADGRHRALPGRERLRPPRHGVVRRRPRPTASVTDVHQTRRGVRGGPRAANDELISPSQIYAYAAIMSRRALRQRRAEPQLRPARA